MTPLIPDWPGFFFFLASTSYLELVSNGATVSAGTAPVLVNGINQSNNLYYPTAFTYYRNGQQLDFNFFFSFSITCGTTCGNSMVAKVSLISLSSSPVSFFHLISFFLPVRRPRSNRRQHSNRSGGCQFQLQWRPECLDHLELQHRGHQQHPQLQRRQCVELLG